MLERVKGNLGTLLLVAILSTTVYMAGCEDKTPFFGGFFVITEDCAFDVLGILFCVPHPNVKVNGAWVMDLDNTAAGNVLNFPQGGSGYLTTDENGYLNVDYGRYPAVWDSGVLWNVPCGPYGQTMASARFNVTRHEPFIGWQCGPVPAPPPLQVAPSPQFSLVGSTPATITIPGTNLSTQHGMPQLYVYVYNSTPNKAVLASQSAATAISSDGTTATFNFPKAANGSALSQGIYSYGIWNVTSLGALQNAAMNFFSLGRNNTSMTTPYGIDVVNLWYRGQDCAFDGLNTYCGQAWTAGPAEATLITLSSTGQVVATNGTITVGSQPTAIKAYGDSTTYTQTDNYGGWYSVDQPSNAIVTNFGSNTVSILDLVNNLVASTISVGTKPVTVVLNSGQSKAYVANYGSSTVSEIDLGYNTQARVAAVGAQPAALAMDPGGTALWVGGLNYITKLDLTTLSAIQSFSVSGQVTSVAVSSGQNSLVYTTVATAGGSTTFQAHQVAMSSGTVQGTYAQYTISSSSYYAAASTTGGPAPGAPGWLMSSGALVSAQYGNGGAVVGTPTGFAVLDLVAKTQIMQGSTPSAVRGIATDPSQGTVYLTAPDSNSLITVPLPATQ